MLEDNLTFTLTAHHGLISFNANMNPESMTVFFAVARTTTLIQSNTIINSRELPSEGYYSLKYDSNNKIRVALYNSGSDEVSDSTSSTAGVPTITRSYF